MSDQTTQIAAAHYARLVKAVASSTASYLGSPAALYHRGGMDDDATTVVIDITCDTISHLLKQLHSCGRR
jgi:hypothetical protein